MPSSLILYQFNILIYTNQQHSEYASSNYRVKFGALALTGLRLVQLNQADGF